jgi:hypothetical protein
MECIKGRFPCIQKYYGLPNKVSNFVILHNPETQCLMCVFANVICICAFA